MGWKKKVDGDDEEKGGKEKEYSKAFFISNERKKVINNSFMYDPYGKCVRNTFFIIISLFFYNVKEFFPFLLSELFHYSSLFLLF